MQKTLRTQYKHNVKQFNNSKQQYNNNIDSEKTVKQRINTI